MRRKLPVIILALIILLQAFVPAVYAASENEGISSSVYLCPFDTPPEGAGSAVANLGKSYGKFGTVVENPGVKITGFSGHAVNQAITRGVTTEVIQSTVKNPVVVLSQRGGNSFAYVSNEAVVVVKNTGEIITTYGKSNFDATVQQVLKEAIK
ncbi:DUF4258 domain-containing protein [Tepidibacillus marianensis]|uniref:DUF4258 domain-containing protein n=1 Tax=Tepidibacillus marianensis TaxID=3131995 RepID=UPI0030D4D74D